MLGTLPSALSMTRLVCCLCKDDGIANNIFSVKATFFYAVHVESQATSLQVFLSS